MDRACWWEGKADAGSEISGTVVGTPIRGFIFGFFCWFREDNIPASTPAGFRGMVQVNSAAGLSLGLRGNCLNMKLLGLLDSEKLIC